MKFNLKLTLESGQFFRYTQKGKGFIIKTRNKKFYVEQKGNKLKFKGTKKEFLRTFFGLNDDLSALHKDKTLKTALNKYPGLRLMNQDPWECLVAFVCSQNSNIKRITKNMEDIAGQAFPNPGELNTKTLKKARLGYREKYLLAINKMVTDKKLASWKKLPYSELKEKLMTLPGVGPKVADCVCLFAYDKKEAFPTDIWIQKIMKQKFGLEPKEIKTFEKKRWGKNAGYAQQYLYHLVRLSH
jgi:N-glycosylase/DNA lyase